MVRFPKRSALRARSGRSLTHSWIHSTTRRSRPRRSDRGQSEQPLLVQGPGTGVCLAVHAGGRGEAGGAEEPPPIRHPQSAPK